MTRLLHALFAGLVGAGIVHIVILLLLPSFSERDAWSRLAQAADLYTVTRIAGAETTVPGDAEPLLAPVDPLFDAVACRFDLTNGIAHLKAPGTVPFWSVSVYDRGGQNIYSFNDRTANDGVLDFLIATPVQMVEIRKSLPPELETSVFVEADVEEGIVVIRSFIPDESFRPAITAYLDSISCSLE